MNIVQFQVPNIPLVVDVDIVNRRVAFIKPPSALLIDKTNDTEVVYATKAIYIDGEEFVCRKWHDVMHTKLNAVIGRLAVEAGVLQEHWF